MRWRDVSLAASRVTCIALAFVLTLARLPRQAEAADGLDLQVQLYQDQNCFVWAEDLTLLDNECYANVYSNLSKAFTLKIVGFGMSGSADLSEYLDECHTSASIKRNFMFGNCKRFVGPYWAVISGRYRSNTCLGESCSRLSIAYQTFYRTSICQDLMYAFRYPLQNECLRWSNGTQKFAVDPTYVNITQVDYLGMETCADEGGFLTRTYTITNGECLQLFGSQAEQSFKWTVDYYQPFTVSKAMSWSQMALSGTAATAAVLTATATLGSPQLAPVF
jgi:hypothetical protein